MTREKSLMQNQSKDEQNNHFQEVSIIELLEELQATPKEYWSNLLQIIRLFRESVTKNNQLFNSEEANQENYRLIKQHNALSELTTLWIEEGDETEQTETWEYLKQKLDENKLGENNLKNR
ncbi:MAG: hypothetical protein AAF378_08220 [Cyanobacteria bacterium P01_A01_bin.84]